MRRSEAARYARWSAAVALLLACLTAGVYLRRGWQSITEQKKAPPPPPVNVEKQSSGLTFSKMDGPRKIFTVEASKSTDFKGREASILENVKVTIFGKTGERHDIIRTQSCQYGKDQSAVICSGDVQLDLESAADAARAIQNPALASQLVHVETRGVTFDRATGAAETTQPVTFAFPNGSGQAIGALYNSQEGTLRLLRDVRLNLTPPAPKDLAKKAAKPAPGEEVEVRGASLDFGRDEKTIHIAGPAEAESRTARLAAGELTLELDQTFHARRLLASAGSPGGALPRVTSQTSSSMLSMDAEKLNASFAPEGWVARLDGAGSVRGSRKGSDGEDEFHSDAAALDMWPRTNAARQLNLSGGVFVKTRVAKTGDSRILQTGALRMDFTEPAQGRSGKATSAQTLTAGSMEWTDASAQPNTPSARTKLQADRLLLAFDEQGKAKQLKAHGHTQVERAAAGRSLQTATADEGAVELVAGGGWTQMDLQGNVSLKEADRGAQADHATFLRVAQSAVLSGQAVARDATTETHAPQIFFSAASGDMRAEGGVRSTDFSPNGGAHLAQVPASISADLMQGNSKTGRAVYTGHARLWQGDSVLEADSIELLRPPKILNAAGNVRAVFPQTPSGQQGATTQRVSASSVDAARAGIPQASPKKAILWHVSSGTLSYNDAANSAHLEKNVVVQSPDQRIRAPEMDLFFTRSTLAGASPNPGAAPVSGAQQISRATAKGGVIVDQAGRRAVADRGEYTAADGKFVMSGGTPTLYDGSSGTTTGRQLTFFLADDTIIVDSENGSRTLTKHRVEK